MTVLKELLDYSFDGSKPALYFEYAGWLRESRRFRAFATAQRDKIRAKLRTVRDEEGMLDLRAELETAVLLLRDERFTLAYESYAASRRRGPDYTVTYKTHTLFNVEVRRIRSAEAAEADGAAGAEGADNAESGARTGKLVAVLCDKVGQMPPGIVNLLWLAAQQPLHEADLARAAAALRRRAEGKDDGFFVRRGYANATAFLRQYSRLSGIVVRGPGAIALWPNPLARHKVPPAIATAIQRLERG